VWRSIRYGTQNQICNNLNRDDRREKIMRVIVAQLDISPETRATFVAYMTHYIDQTRTEQGNLAST
jgi:hypothetical protein